MSELAVGLMSGTSLDGIDAALVTIDSTPQLQLLAFRTMPFLPSTRCKLSRVLAGGTVRDIALIHVELGELFAAATLELLEHAGVSATEVSFIASHGQTMWHEPRRASLQLGDAAVIAERVGVRVVSNFRERDVAAGGEGAPLVAIADVHLFAHQQHGRALLNLGGMANVTWVPRRGSDDGVIAFDTGPGVAIVDAVVAHFDPSLPFDDGGRQAGRGEPEQKVVDCLLGGRYFSLDPPKSTGREVFGDSFAQDLIRQVRASRPGASADDCVATAVSLTAQSVAEGCSRWIPEASDRDLLVSGGGLKNLTLMKMLAEQLRGFRVLEFRQEFFDGDAKEAAAFAYLGWLTLAGRPGNVPSATGASSARILGTVTPA